MYFDVAMGWNCDWCGGTLRHFPNAKSGIRCESCWRTEGKNNGKLNVVKRSDPEHYTNRQGQTK